TVVWRVTYIRPDFFHDWALWELLVFYVTSYWGQVGWEAVGLQRVVVAMIVGLSLLGWLTSLRLILSQFPLRLFWGSLALLVAAAVAAVLFLYQSNPWWRIPLPFAATLAAVLLLGWWLHQRQDPIRRLALPQSAWRILWLAVTLTLLAIIKNALTTPQYQGRFLFPSLGALAFLTAAGWYALLPRRRTRHLPALTIAFMVSLNLLLWLTRVIPVYYQPFLDN
ncbi:MAG: hypothetical protein ACRDIB_19660, partial [Ardenticatenaceae bacterium]